MSDEATRIRSVNVEKVSHATFEYSDRGSVECETAVLSVAYLLEWATIGGERPLEGNAAVGIAKLLHCVAREVERQRRRSSLDLEEQRRDLSPESRDELLVELRKQDGLAEVSALRVG